MIFVIGWVEIGILIVEDLGGEGGGVGHGERDEIENDVIEVD